MDVLGRMIRVQNELVHVRWIEMKYARFMMIYPYDGMIVVIVHGIGPLPFRAAEALTAGIETGSFRSHELPFTALILINCSIGVR